MSNLAPVYAYSIAIPQLLRADTASVFGLAADRLEALALNGYLPEAATEPTLAAAAGRYQVLYRRPPQPWIVPLFRDVMGLDPDQLREWEAEAPLIGRAFLLRAFAHAIQNRDI